MGNVRVGLTGGIGSGKSTVAQWLAMRGAYVIDADAIAREVVAPGTAGLAALTDAFGSGVIQADGSLDRAGLAAVAFADAKSRQRLDAITHPLIRERTLQLYAAAPDGAVIVHDVALLTELTMAAAYDLVVVVDCPDDVRVSRLLGRGLTEQDARARMAAQATREQRLAIADEVIDNSGSLAELEEQVDRVWDRISA
ncbi:MAG: dephospho-CoA kinase, partial [Candidatus Nanopelagicales bacterium]